jgi:LL-diaminopimelate aminotransferase
MPKPAERLNRFSEYVFARLAKCVAEVEKKTGRKVLGFGAGSPDIRPSEKYLAAFAAAIHDEKAHLYPGYGATPAFADALAEWYHKRFGVSLTRDEIVPLLGAKDGTSHLPLALLDDGDEMLIPNPGYPGFSGPLVMYGIKPVYYPLTADCKLDVAAIEPLVTARTKAIIVNFPSNPTGQVATREELAAVVALAKKHNIVLVYDNAYAEIAFDGYRAPSILEIPGAKDVAVEFGSFSKTYSFAGYRMGWMVGNADVCRALLQVKSQVDSGMSLPLQSLAATALTETDLEWQQSMIREYTRRRDIIAEKLKTLGLTFELPRAGLYIWAKIPETAVSSEDFCMKLLEERQILITPGSAFGSGGERYVRVSICVNIDAINSYF